MIWGIGAGYVIGKLGCQQAASIGSIRKAGR